MNVNNVQMPSPTAGSGGKPVPTPVDAGSQAPRAVEPTGSPVAQQAAKAAVGPKEVKPQHEEIKDAVEKLNKTALVFDRTLRFQIDDKTHDVSVSVIDQNSDRVIRQIPSQEILDLVAKMEKYIGLIFDKKA